MRRHSLWRFRRQPATALVAALAAIGALAAAGCGTTKSTGSASNAPAPTTASKGAAAGSSHSANAIKIGVLTTCGGAFALFENEAFSGAKYALVQAAGGKSLGKSPQAGVSGATIAGRPVSLYYGCSDATPDVAVSEARRLVESDKINILVGPLSGDEGIAVANYAKTQPQVAFINGTSGAQATTMSVHAPNFFRFGGDGAQWMAGLGSYAYKDLHWRKAAILGEDYSYPYTQAAAFVSEFCGLGGQITKRIWAPLTTTDWSSYATQIPSDVDGFVLLTGGTDTIDILKAYLGFGKQIKGHVLGGSSVMDPTSFALGSQLAGLTGGSPVPLGGSSSAWTAYVKGFSSVYDKSVAQSLFTVLYYDGMMSAIKGLEQVKGSLANDESAFRAALTKMKPTFPNGQVSLDANRNSIQPAYIVQVQNNGGLGFKVLRTIPNVKQDFGGVFKPSSPAPSRTSPACNKGPLPPWSQG
jgi:branched-chain amino acid transport system substrate-binding protein